METTGIIGIIFGYMRIIGVCRSGEGKMEKKVETTTLW